MAENKVDLRVVTPTEIKIQKDADMVIMRCIDGDMGVQPGHAPFSVALDYGVLRIVNEGEEQRLAIYGGFAEIKDNALTIVTNGADFPEDIDYKRAEAERERAEQRLHDHVTDVEVRNAQVLLRRALVRIEVSSYPFISRNEENE